MLAMDSFDLEKLPWEGSNDTDPVWVGEKIYFLSDRGPNVRLNIWRYDTATEELTQVTDFANFDISEEAMAELAAEA